MGLKGDASSIIDSLVYEYSINSNKLLKVTDVMSDAQTKLGDFKDGTNAGNDYGYDSNGNMVTDLNKNITGTTELNTTGSITYNHLNLPVII